MWHLSTLCLGLVALGPGQSDPPAATGVSISTEDAPALIRRALEFEASGLLDQERHCLEAALRAEPDNPRAHGLLGHVRSRGTWLTAEEAVAKERADEERSALLAEYESRRAAARDTTAAQWKLALWCESKGLKPEATAHLTEVTRLDPQDRAAWLKLGCRLYNGRWQNPEQIAAQEAEIEAQAEADRYWRPRLARWKAWLADSSRQSEAVRELSLVHVPRAVPSVVRVFDGAPKWQRWAVYLLGRVDAPGAAQALASLAVNGLNEPIRESAIQRLGTFDPRMYVGLLINWIRQPTRYEIQGPSSGRDDTVVLIEGPGADIERHYRAVAAAGTAGLNPIGSRIRGDTRGEVMQTGRVSRLQSNGRYELFDQQVRVTPTRGTASESELARAAVEERISADLREIDRANEPTEETNVRVIHTLYQLTGKSLGADQQAWASWWTEQLGYRSSSSPPGPKPLVVQEIATPYVPPPPRVVVTQTQVVSSHSCFAAGTPVVTRVGSRPIERVKVGDQVLTQDTETGSLGFEPVLAVLHNPPSTVLRLTLENGDQIVATDIHRFWQAGRGWRMTRQLKTGDRLRVAGGTTEVFAVSREPTQRVHNLEVARNHDFFVGRTAVLVHDASLVTPGDRVFDRDRLQQDRPGSQKSDDGLRARKVDFGPHGIGRETWILRGQDDSPAQGFGK